MSDKITIGLFIDTFYPMIDGVFMVIDNYAKRLLKYGNVIVFAPEYPGKKCDDSQFEYKIVRCKSLKLPIVDYSLPIPKLDKKQACEIINKKHKIEENEKVFLFVGRINALKNIFFIAKSIKNLKELDKNFKFKMIFVGTGQDEKELKKWIKNNNMENDIILCGKVTDSKLLAMYYARADLFLFPSLYDTSSLVQIEAASQNTPTLFIEGAATASKIENNKNGFISKMEELEYAKSILKIIKDEKLYNKVSKNCYNELYINWDTEVENVYNNYKKLMK